MREKKIEFAIIPHTIATKPEIDIPPDRVIDPVIGAYKKDVDRTLLIENLKLTSDERFREFDAYVQGVMALRQAGIKFRQYQNSDQP